MEPPEERQQHREITDEDIRRMEARIGVEIPQPRPYNEYATLDAIRHYAEGIGDDNPLFNDPEYARKTRWGGIIAPPYFVETMGVSKIKEIPPEVREKGRGALSGIHGWYSGDTVELWLPVHAGDRTWARVYVGDVQVKQSEFAGRTVHFIRRQESINQRGELLARADRLYIRGGRERTPGERRKYIKIERQRWTPEQIEEIAAEYRNERRRGGEPRYWENVEIGEQLPRRIKGPLTISDMIRFAMGRGSPYIRAHKLAFAYRDKHPNAFPADEYGVPDIVERVHWSDDLAHKTGNPAPYDYGAQRVAWLCQLISDWAGDDGFLRRIHAQLRRFNYVGDVTYCKGTVEDKFERDGQYLVRCKVWCEDQRGETTSQGWAEVALPSRESGPVKLVIRPAEPSGADRRD
ncbi:MAG: MaoC family dehydratase N-terminal domain-containing protein [Deltaproteobacteria bacterium]|nr:MaoC family dehydratase N-terminal domain-containing protein [Deltaproteobacteria bacterium]